MRLTTRQGAVISAYTGVLAGTFDALHAYAEELMGRPVFTHEFPDLASELQRRSKADFLEIVADGTHS